MEQRIGSSSRPLEGAGFDPAFIPGLTSPVSGEPEDATAEEVREDGTAAADAADAESAEKPGAGESGAEESGTGEPGAEEDAHDGPVFEASDRRARIVADRRGVSLALDDQQCEFRWDEIGAVETQTGRFGRRFTVTVHTTDRRWYPIEIDAPSRSRFPEWERSLDEVLDAYFEEGGTTPDAETGTDADPDASGDSTK